MKVTMDLKLLGQHIQEARNRCGHTQATVAALIGVSDSYISRIETGRAKMSMQRFFTIAVAIQTAPGDLLVGCCPEITERSGQANTSPEKEHMYELINRASGSTLKTFCSVCDALIATLDGKK